MKEDLKHAEQFLDTYLGGNRNVSTLTWNHWVECLADYKRKPNKDAETIDLNPSKEIYKVKALFFTQCEADKWNKIPIELTYGGLISGNFTVRAFTKHSEVFDMPITSLCIWINDTPCHKILFEDGRIFSLATDKLGTDFMYGSGYGEAKTQNLLEYLKDLHDL